jgi:tRNA (Thr-GGU) A37 N-methylase
VWLLFVFHDNRNESVKDKVSPPRLEGIKVGVFSTRSPHRPNPIGLSVAKLDKVEGSTLHLSGIPIFAKLIDKGIDLIDGTPILDVKPYIALYDSVKDSRVASWITEAPRPPLARVLFTSEAEESLREILPRLKFYTSFEEIRSAIEAILITDPRSIFIRFVALSLTYVLLRKAFGEDTYGFCIDILNILCKFNNDEVTVIGLEDWSSKPKKQGPLFPKVTDEECDATKLFWEVHHSLPREGPGSNETTKRAANIIKQHLARDHLHILDVGCGPGMQTIQLVQDFSDSQITALDSHKPYLDELRRRAKGAGPSVQQRITVVEGSMHEMKQIFTNKQFDIIWAEGKRNEIN